MRRFVPVLVPISRTRASTGKSSAAISRAKSCRRPTNHQCVLSTTASMAYVAASMAEYLEGCAPYNERSRRLYCYQPDGASLGAGCYREQDVQSPQLFGMVTPREAMLGEQLFDQRTIEPAGNWIATIE